MKTITLVIAMAFGLMSFAGGDDTAPEKVLNAFKIKFPTATNVEWEKENEKEWEAEFKMNGKEYSANFGADGTWMETEYEIDVKDLPAKVKATLDSQFKGYEIEGAERVETPTFKGYEVEIEKGETTMEVVLDESGKVLKKKIEEDEDEDEDHDHNHKH